LSINLPSPKGPEVPPSPDIETYTVITEVFSMVVTGLPLATEAEVQHQTPRLDTSGSEDTGPQVSAEAGLPIGNESNSTGSGDYDESRAIQDEEDDEETPHTERAVNYLQLPPLFASDGIMPPTRYCVICCLDQPLRCKHCNDCNKCVILHDHHCPWLGNCVGGHNRLVFYWYLTAQATELWMALIMTGTSFTRGHSVEEWFEDNALRLGLLGLLLFFTAMVTSLLAFHSYLAVTNKTTCKG
jgi:palmitoyltransferase